MIGPQELFDLTGKVAVVTGGSLRSSGVRGADRDRAQGVRERLQRGRWADCDDLVEAVYGRCGRCDVLVSNAGMSPL